MSKIYSFPPNSTTIELWADQTFRRAKRVVTGHYGSHVIHNRDEYLHANWAIYAFRIPKDGEYWIRIQYACDGPPHGPRPVNISSDYNGFNVINANALATSTGGYSTKYQKWETVGTARYLEGVRTLRIHRSRPFPHIRKIIIEYKNHL
ncbi:hypothetical protein RM697_09380 [Ichthyenterobacterium sp. W332]|uniref:Uncharacterized protein n=1 Tax=Microcosmobacter mediterraneus TaxID=3075607 RepID=A0ABU2YL23_9FLAO|nr:hypothetical protein [Ichthyenterobacterium sp. W332]MDT0558860.1 hypothetical protein [Ichthyenterobacterium sp. W332]